MTSKEAAAYNWKQLEGKPLSAKLQHILLYYWGYLLVAVVAVVLAVSVVHHYATVKESAFFGYCLNSPFDQAGAEALLEDFVDYAGIDLAKNTAQIEAATYGDVVAARISVRAVDFAAADTEVFEELVFGGACMDLSQILPAKRLEECASQLLYAERRVVYVDYDMDEDITDMLRVGDPEGMSDPIPVGIWIPAGNRLTTVYEFPGGDAIFCIMGNSQHPETAAAFLEFILS